MAVKRLSGIHDLCLAAGLPVETVRRKNGTAEIVLCDDATSEQQEAADEILATELARADSEEEKWERFTSTLRRWQIARAAIQKSYAAELDRKFREFV